MELPGTPRTGPGTPRTAPITPMGPRGTPLTPRMAPITPPAAGSTVWAPHRSHVQVGPRRTSCSRAAHPRALSGSSALSWPGMLGWRCCKTRCMLTPKHHPTPRGSYHTLAADNASLLQAKSPWDSPATHVPSPLSYDRNVTPDHSFLSSLNPMDSAYCGRADAAWGEGADEPRSARIAQLQQQQLRPTGSAPSTLTRRSGCLLSN